MNLVLYTGPDCHLCDLAKRELEILNNLSIDVELINIRKNTEHYHLYATRIPVLQRKDNSQELGWPFSAEQIRSFIE